MQFSYRLFLDPGASVPSALTTDSAIVAEMAKSAVLVSPGGSFSGPDIKIEQPAQAAAPGETPQAAQQPAPAVQQTPAAQATPAAPAQPNQVAPAQAAPAAAEPTVSWQEILKQQPVADVFKALGLDDATVKFVNGRKTIDPKIAGLIAHYEAKGDVKPYFEALTMDYSKMTDQEVVRRQLQARYPDVLSPEEFEELYRDEVIDKYKLDADIYDEKQRKLGLIRLKADAHEPRTAMIAKQRELLLNPPPEPQVPQELIDYQQRDKSGKEAREAYASLVSSAPQIKDIIQKKQITLGEGADVYNMPVENPEEVFSTLTDDKKWGALMFNEDNSPKIDNQTLFAIFAHNPKKFLADYAKHHQSIGASRALNPIENASQQSGTPARDGNQPLDPIAEMAKNGVLVSAAG